MSAFSLGRTRLGADTATPVLVISSDQGATCHRYIELCSALLSCVGGKKDKNTDLGDWRNTGCKEAALCAGFGLGELGPGCCPCLGCSKTLLQPPDGSGRLLERKSKTFQELRLSKE